MGVDYSVVVMVGVSMTFDELFETRTEPSCKHPAAQNAKFCPECGKAKRSRIVLRAPFKRDDDTYDDGVYDGMDIEADVPGLVLYGKDAGGEDSRAGFVLGTLNIRVNFERSGVIGPLDGESVLAQCLDVEERLAVFGDAVKGKTAALFIIPKVSV